jgi:hypothetical protein
MNCEAMVRFRPAIRPEQFLDQFAYRKQRGNDTDGEPILNGWIERYQAHPVEQETADEEADKVLEQIRVEIAALALRARFTGSPDHLVMTLDSTDRGACKALLTRHQGVLFELCPMGLSGERPFVNLEDATSESIVFENVTMAQAGAWILIHLTHLGTGRAKSFVVKAATEMAAEFWEERRIAFLKDNLDARDFRAFLRSILFGEAIIREPIQGPEPGNSDRTDPPRDPALLLDEFTVEDVLQSCTEDSSRIGEIDRLVKTFEMTEHIDPSFREFWANFREAITLIEQNNRR